MLMSKRKDGNQNSTEDLIFKETGLKLRGGNNVHMLLHRDCVSSLVNYNTITDRLTSK